MNPTFQSPQTSPTTASLAALAAEVWCVNRCDRSIESSGLTRLGQQDESKLDQERARCSSAARETCVNPGGPRSLRQSEVGG